jgi:nucleotide-binding universal stress UspA family protein
LREEGERTARSGREALAARGLAADIQVVEGDPRERIVEIAQDWRADLVVIGGRGLGALMGALLGSVSTAVLRRAVCPVLVVKWRSTRMRRALVAVDGSEDSWAAAQSFARLPLPKESTVRLLAVLDVPPMMAPTEGAAPAMVTTPEALISERRAQLEGILSRVAASYQGVVRDVERSVVVGGPAAEIVSAAREPGVDLVVVGARGLGPIRRWLLGSVSEHVLHHADCPVLVVPPSPAGGP